MCIRDSSDFRYYGPSPGNKKIGVNVKYASDPYHGEKIGGIAYTQDKNMGSKDYEKYTIGITNKTANVMEKPSSGSKVFYKLSNKNLNEPVGIPVVILGTSGDYYKVQSDMGVKSGNVHFENLYDHNGSVGYIPKSSIDIERKGKSSVPADTADKLTISSIKISPVSYTHL